MMGCLFDSYLSLKSYLYFFISLECLQDVSENDGKLVMSDMVILEVNYRVIEICVGFIWVF